MACSLLRNLSLLAMAAAGVLGQQLDTKLSFGYIHPLSKDSQSVPEWDINGEPHNPGMHSDRIIFTPGYESARTSMWAQNKNTHPEWIANLKFRAHGPERGGGMFQIWYEKQGKANVGLNSIYTIDKFDGLAIVIDTYGGQAGSIRAFLNDGTKSFKNSHAVDSLAFGHCSFGYRNLGYPSEVKLTMVKDYFQVEVGGRLCFKSDKVKLPWDYYFGLNAQTSSNPDSFEVFSFGVSSDSHIAPHDDRPNVREPTKPGSGSRKFEEPEDRVAEYYKSQQEQFADLHNRIQSLTHLVSTLYQEVVLLRGVSERVEEHSKSQARADQMHRVEYKLDTIERAVQAIKTDVEGKDYKEHLNELQQSLRDTHSSLLEHLPRTLSHIVINSMPRMGFFIFLIVVSQVLLAGSYLIYKRRQKMRPKKYL